MTPSLPALRITRTAVALAGLLLVFAVLSVQAQSNADALPAAGALAAGWNRIDVPGAVCAQGDPYAFFVRPGDPEKLMVYFQGGGACWDRATCGAFGPYDKNVTDAASEIGAGGLFDFTDPRNPVADHTVVFVSYCTGDVHTGSASETLAGDPPVTIQFHGYDNATAVLDWTVANYPNATDIFVTGTSAGAYGAIFNAWRIFDAYPGAARHVLGDAGVGITPAGWRGFDLWGTLDHLPDGMSLPAGSGGVAAALYGYTAEAYPEAGVAEYTTVADNVQALFYSFMGGIREDWVPALREALVALEAAGVLSYAAPGTSHGILPAPAFYTTEADGVALQDWLARWLAGQPVESVPCAACS